MENWKRALVAGSAAAGVLLFMKRQKTAGMLCTGISLATLASEYPEKFAEVRENLRDYIEQGEKFMEIAARVGERIAEAAEGRTASWYESLLA
jgi:hypothetical protein